MEVSEVSATREKPAGKPALIILLTFQVPLIFTFFCVDVFRPDKTVEKMQSDWFQMRINLVALQRVRMT